jgi:hypothetical protein
MSKRTLSDWAAIAEIVGTIAVVVSLLFVASSIQQNTAELRLQNNNYMYEQANSALEALMSQPLLVETLTKVEATESLTTADEYRHLAWVTHNLNRWEMAFYWHQDG